MVETASRPSSLSAHVRARMHRAVRKAHDPLFSRLASQRAAQAAEPHPLVPVPALLLTGFLRGSHRR